MKSLPFYVGRFCRAVKWLFSSNDVKPPRTPEQRAYDLSVHAAVKGFARTLDITEDIVAALRAEPHPPKERRL